MRKYLLISLLILQSPLLFGQCGTETCDEVDNDLNGYIDEPHLLWQNVIGSYSDDNATYMTRTADGGVILVTYSYADHADGDLTTPSHGDRDLWVVKLDASGNIQWQNMFGGIYEDWIASIEQTSDGGYILGGSSRSPASGNKTSSVVGGQYIFNGYIWNFFGAFDYWILKLDATGAIMWQNRFGGTSSDDLSVIHQTSDGGYILGGSSYSNADGDKTANSRGGYDFWIIKTNSSGAIQWQHTFGGNQDDVLTDIRETTDGGFIVGGTSSSGISGDKTEPSQGERDFWILKLSGTGNIEWQNTIGGSDRDILKSIRQTSDGGYIIGGATNSGIGGDKIDPLPGLESGWIVKLNTAGGIAWQKTIGGSSFDVITCIIPTADGNYLFGGQSSSGVSGDITEPSVGNGDYWIGKLDAAGNITWQIKMGGAGEDGIHQIEQAPDHTFFVSGASSTAPISCDKNETGNGSSDFWVLKFSRECNDCNMTVDAGVNASSYFGYPPEENVTRHAAITGGTGPFTYSWTLDRAPLSGETMSDPSLPTITVKLIQPAELRVHVVDRNACIADDAVNINAEDVRCSISPLKVFVCDKGRTKCLSIPAAQNQIFHGAHIGTCASFRSSGTVGDDDVEASPGFNVFPNPSTGTFTIHTGITNSDDVEALVRIINVNGQIIKEQKLLNQPSIKMTVDKPGIYLVQFIKANQVYSKKILITH